MSAEKWEYVTTETHRLRVPGGWIYRTLTVSRSPSGRIGNVRESSSEALCYVPDPSDWAGGREADWVPGVRR